MKRVFCTALALAFVFLGCGLPLAQQPVRSCADNALGTGCATIVAPLAPSSATESSHAFKVGAGTLIAFSVNNLSGGGLTIFLMDAAAVPANGAVATCAPGPQITTPCLIKAYGLPAAVSSAQTATDVINWAPGPLLHFYNGIIAACSSTAPPTLTLAASCWFAGDVQ